MLSSFESAVAAEDIRTPLAKLRIARVLSFQWSPARKLLAAEVSKRNGLFRMAKELFGTDGIRGVPGTPPLDDATLYATGLALGMYLRSEHGAAHVLIGMDTRESGPHIAALLAAGLGQSGATI